MTQEHAASASGPAGHHAADWAQDYSRYCGPLRYLRCACFYRLPAAMAEKLGYPG
jgi:hypothetical protein